MRHPCSSYRVMLIGSVQQGVRECDVGEGPLDDFVPLDSIPKPLGGYPRPMLKSLRAPAGVQDRSSLVVPDWQSHAAVGLAFPA
jgi:hypothetical protein